MPYSSGKTSSTSQNMAKVSKAPIVACLTCPLCGNLFREATTISECLHTFCKECIHERFSDDEVNSCPMCNVSLGCSPMEKLRADPQLDDVQAKIFNFVPKKMPPGKLPSSTMSQAPSPVPARRKERSLSSLGVVSLPSTSRARRARHRTWVEEASEDEAEEGDAVEEEQQEKDERRKKRSKPDATDLADDEAAAIYCSETLDLDPKDKAAAGLDDDRNGPTSTGRRGKRNKSKQLDADFLSPLARLAEIADEDEKKFVAGMDDDVRENEAKLSLRATKNVRRSSSAKASGSRSHSAAAAASSSSPPSNGIWFTLAPAASQASGGEDVPALPRINTPYLRIKDGKLPVSFVKKYLAKKLDLKNETEVEITCLGQPVVSSLPLESVRKIWLAKDSGASRQVLNNDSLGKEFLMVLTYRRNRRTSAPSAPATSAGGGAAAAATAATTPVTPPASVTTTTVAT